ncbi:unnamed protein product [Adineta steineri]|uniref:Cytosolic carboxypeptidase-like protein 5 n=1 Tax=Adineta steineri TaxID=433720 RepID=A0A814T0T4_9BILA|nr:unnamed protein product [Adineta steineri]CAF3968079.1 unnamed protein product [Adineta steineri]CAF4033789.1 unnamed protein product [Adineta steineri]CAF4052545.1 unnamed protein product [Adineta steineri]
MTTEIDDIDIQRASPYAFHYVNENLELHRDLFPVVNDDDDEDEGNLGNQMKGNEGSDDEDDMFSSGQNNENGVHEPKSPHLSNPDFLKISPYESGIAYYLDLHGHASKKGCFIYGNHLPDDEQHTDNILFPKLISLNSPHFEYDNCLSKEGSGRVALNKHFGILHSYTLECSYAVGKSCNAIPPAENESHGGRVSPPTPCSLPPKFTVEHYRDVGKACALAAIDILPARNPFTRVTHSTFKTLHTLRDYLKHQIRQQRNKMGNSRTNASQISSVTNNRAKQQQQYLTRVTHTYRTTNNTNNLVTTTQQQQISSTFSNTFSGPPSTVRITRTASNNQLNRASETNFNQQTSSRLKLTYDNRRYSNTEYKRTSQPTMNSNLKVTPKLSLVEVVSLPPAHLILQQQVSSPSRLQQQHSSSSPQFVIPSSSVLDPLVLGRYRPAPLPPPPTTTTNRNTLPRNAVSLNALPFNQQNKTVTRGRLPNTGVKGPLSTRTSKMRQQSLAPFDIQQSIVPYPSTSFIYRHLLNTDLPPVFFE